MLAIFAFTPMTKRLLGIVCTTIGTALLLLGLNSAHSEGSLTWAAHNAYLLFGGSVVALTTIILLTLRYDHLMSPFSPPTQLCQDNPRRGQRRYSLKGKILYLYTGAFVGGILGQILIYDL